jgi:hypothetical protein
MEFLLTGNMMKPSRQVIPVEIMVSLFALSYAGYGSIPWPEATPLFKFIFSREGWIGIFTWAIIVGIPPFWLMLVSGREWLFCKKHRWGPFEIDASATLRGRLVVTQMASWLYLLHLAFLSPSRKPMLIIIHAMIGAVICAWSYWENRRVRREIKRSTAAYYTN